MVAASLHQKEAQLDGKWISPPALSTNQEPSKKRRNFEPGLHSSKSCRFPPGTEPVLSMQIPCSTSSLASCEGPCALPKLSIDWTTIRTKPCMALDLTQDLLWKKHGHGDMSHAMPSSEARRAPQPGAAPSEARAASSATPWRLPPAALRSPEPSGTERRTPIWVNYNISPTCKKVVGGLFPT